MSKAQALHKLMFVVGLLFALLVAFQSHASLLKHALDIEISPGLKMLKGRDVITFPANSSRKLSFLLHKNLRVQVLSTDDSVALVNPARGKALYAEYGLQLGNSDNKVTLEFSGVIYDPIVDNESRGLISPQGAALFEETYWYPSFLGLLKNHDITLTTPADWRALTQGQLVSTAIHNNTRRSRFVSIYPQEEISLVAGAFHVYEVNPPGAPKVEVYLKQADAALAQSFLSLVPNYISHYAQEIAPYPYSSFAVVENFWETGYALPGFTLLGPTVIRLPFILNSSLPHEVLHNWWGNGVFVDYNKGNWCEGLTTYMADHWQQESAGQGANYRLKTLINYNDFVVQNPANDFPVRQFRGRHNASSQAVGYGKTMMIFRMLELQFGKELFKKALQEFYKDNQFKKVSFEEIQASFEKVTGQNLSAFFYQWLDRKGALELALGEVRVIALVDGTFVTTFALLQNQSLAYNSVVPLVWTLSSGEEVRQIVRLTDRVQFFTFSSSLAPVKIAVDPQYDVFRTLHLEERPATLSSILGSKKVHFYLNSKDAGSAAFLKKWNESLEGAKISHELNGSFHPTTEGSMVLIGDRPEFREFMRDQLAGQNWSLSESGYQIMGQSYLWNETSTAVVARNKMNPQQTIVWVRWHQGNDPAEWAGRLLHYGTFGVLVFKGRPNVMKTTWPVVESPLVRRL